MNNEVFKFGEKTGADSSSWLSLALPGPAVPPPPWVPIRLAADVAATAAGRHSENQDRSADMETRDMAEVVETFRRKFMEDVAGAADCVAGA